MLNVDFLSILSAADASLGDTFVYPKRHLGLFVFALIFFLSFRIRQKIFTYISRFLFSDGLFSLCFFISLALNPP